jgi:hypothetical protein
LGFYLHNTEGGSIDAVARRVQDALSIPFENGEFRHLPAYVARALGMEIGLFTWAGPGQRLLFVLQGAVADPAFVTFRDDIIRPAVLQDISDAVSDLLDVRGGGSWHRPTDEEIAAHVAYERSQGN